MDNSDKLDDQEWNRWQNEVDIASHELKKRIFAQHSIERPPSSAYHYCAAQSMVSILTKEVWLSELAHMNDPAEGLLIEQLIKKLKETKELKNDLLRERLIIHLEENAAHERVGDVVQIAYRYVLSLSIDGDALNLWRFYGDDGYGYAVEFDLHCLEREIRRQLPEFTTDPPNITAIQPIDIRRVAYEDLEVLALAIIDAINQDNTIQELAGQEKGNSNYVTWNICNRIYEMAYFYKSKDWEAEQEVRAMTIGYVHVSDDVYKNCRGYHIRGKYLVPHIAVSTQNDLNILKSVISGPRLDPHFVRRAYDQLIRPTSTKFRLYNKDFLRFSEKQYRPVLP